jgi:hypothetical protein
MLRDRRPGDQLSETVHSNRQYFANLLGGHLKTGGLSASRFCHILGWRFCASLLSGVVKSDTPRLIGFKHGVVGRRTSRSG